jgi:phosphoribosylamine--glycine ligase
MLDGKFGTASKTVVIEEFLSGIKFCFRYTDGKKTIKYYPKPRLQAICEGDKGLNTEVWELFLGYLLPMLLL